MEDYRLEQTGQEVQRILNEAAMQVDLNTEVERATDAEGTLQDNIDAEEQARQDADGLLQQAVDDEEQRAKDAEEANAGEIDGIKALIPSTATSANKLVDVNQMNSSIATATATYRGNYNLVTDLHLAIDATHAQIETLLGTVIAEADNNDYCYVMVPTSAETPTQIAKIERYKFNGTAWAFEYDVNNSGYTAAQWAAINSGITSGLVAKLNALPSNTDLLALLAGKQDVLTFDDVPVEGSNNVVKSGGVHSAIDDEKTARVNNVNTLQGEIDGIEGKIPSGASSANKLVDTATMESAVSTATATFRGDYNLVSDLHLAIDATHAQIATMLASEISTADNNDYVYVEIPTNAETPAQIARVERYKFNGTEWGYEYTLNNSGFTANQWAAINSMITSGLVDKLTALPTNSDLLALLAQKQDVLTWDQTPTENSTNPVTSGGVYAADKALSDAIEAILLLIPSAASSLNKLVDTALMNSSISTATATFRGTYNLVSDLGLGIDATEGQIAAALLANISTADNNDYAFVMIPTSAETPAQIARTDRYKFNGTAWAFEYTLNTSGFTAAQWAAINSTITSALVAKLNALPTASELQEALGTLTSGITAINQKIPSTASQSNKLVDNASMESYIAQVINILDASFNVTSTDGHITLHITQVDGKITAVQVQSTDIASVADLALKASQADLTALASRVSTAEGNITSLTGRMGTAETNIANLQQLYNNLQQSKPVPVTSLPSTGQQQGVIYRLAGTNSYSDYMWNGSSWVLMATYNNAIDAFPTGSSGNLVTSNGVAMSEANMKGMVMASNASNDAKKIASAIVSVEVWTDSRYSQNVAMTTFGLYGNNFIIACYSGSTNIGNLYLLSTGSYPSDGIVTYEKYSEGYRLFYMRITIDWSRYNGERFNETSAVILLPNAEDYNSNSFYLKNTNLKNYIDPLSSFYDTDIIRRGMIGYNTADETVKAITRCIVDIKCWVKDEFKNDVIGLAAFGVYEGFFELYVDREINGGVQLLGKIRIIDGTSYPTEGVVTYYSTSDGYANVSLKITIDWSKYYGEQFALADALALYLYNVESMSSNSYYLNNTYIKPVINTLNDKVFGGVQVNEYIVDVNGTVGINCDYTSLRACVDYLNTIIDWTGGSPEKVNRSVIKIMPGTYNIRSYYTNEEWNADDFIGLRVPRNCQIIGLGKKRSDVIITCTGESTQQYGYMKSTLNITDDTYIENVTIYGENVRYAIHDDYSNYIYANKYLNHREIKNVDFIGKNLIYAAVYGAGDAGGSRWNFEDCRFVNLTDLCCFSVHDRNDTADQKLADEYSFKNCQFLGNRNGQRVKKNIEFCPLLSGCENRAIIVGCSFDSIRINMDSAGETSLSSIDVRGWGNTKKYQVYFNTQSGKAFTPKFSDEIIEGLNVDSVNIVWGDYVIADEYNQLTKGTEANHTGIAIEDIAVGDYGAINTNTDVTYVNP